MNNAAALVGRSSLSLIILIVGCALLASTMGKTYADLGGAFSPVFFPRIILVGWIVMAALSVISDALGNKESGSTQWGTVVLVSVSLFVYIQLMPLLGFFIVSVVFCAIVLLATGQRKPLDILVFSVAIPGSLVALFNHVLTMPLPVSPFVWWL